MATTIKAGTIEVWLSARTQALTQGINQAVRSVQQLGKRFQSAGRSITAASRTFTIAGLAIGAAIALPLKTFAQFEQAMANTQSVAGATAEEYNKLSIFAREMGKTTVFSAKEAADAMYFLASAGQSVEEIMQTLPGVLNLAAATMYGLAETSRITVATLNQFGMETGESVRVANVFAATISKSQATMEKLGASMMYIGPLARTLNWSLEETTAILGKLYDAGYEASMAGTALRMGMSQLLDPSDKAQEVLKRLGLTVEDINPTMHSLADILETLSDSGMEAADAIRLFGLRSGPAMMALVQQGSVSIRELEKTITGTDKAAEMAAVQLDTLSGELKLLQSALTETQIVMMKKFGDTLKHIIRDRLRPWVEELNIWLKTNRQMVTTFISAAAAIAILFVGLGIFGFLLGHLITGIGTLLVLFGGLVGFFTSLPGLLVLAGAALVAFLTAGNWDKIKDFFLNLKQQIQDWAKGLRGLPDAIARPLHIITANIEATDTLLKSMKTDFDKWLADRTKKVVEATADDFKKLNETTKTSWKKFCDWWKVEGDEFNRSCAILYATISQTITNIIDTIAPPLVGATMRELEIIIRNGTDAILGVLNIFTGLMTFDWEQFWQGLNSICESIMQTMIATIENGMRTIKELFQIGMPGFGQLPDWVTQGVPFRGGGGVAEDIGYTGPGAGTHAEDYFRSTSRFGSMSTFNFHIPGADDPDLVASKVVQKIKQLERVGQFKLAPELAR